MKFTLVAILCTMAAGVLASPAPELDADPALFGEAKLDARSRFPSCKYYSNCGIWARECEWWCENVGGFDHMEQTNCFPGLQRCCCKG